MRSSLTLRPAAAALSTCSLLAALALGACAGSNASYTRFRRAADTGRVVASHEIRVADFVNRFAQEDATPAVIDSADATALYVDARLASPHLPAHGATALLGVTLRGVPRTARTPADLVVVVDVSGSMNEEGKITAVQHALARMVETFDPADRIAIVTFASDAHLALAPTTVGAARPVVLGAISSLTADGGTNIFAGLANAVTLVSGMRTSNTRVLLLSDGVATEGPTGRSDILHAATPLRAMHVPLTTIGVGDAIDFELLETLAREHGGAFHFVDQPSEVERVFATYVSSITEISARSVELVVTAPPGGRVVRAFDDRAALADGGALARVPVGDLGASDAYVGLFEIQIPAGHMPIEIPVQVGFRTIDGLEELVAQHPAPCGFDGSTDYAMLDAREPALHRAATMGYAAIGLREAALADERGDVATAEGWLRSTLASVEASQRVLGQVDPARASTLEEPIALLRRAHGATLARLPAPVVAATNAAPVVLVGPAPQTITPTPGLSVVPTHPAPAGPSVVAAPAAPSSTQFAGWR